MCPGTPRGAHLTTAIPAGAEVVWSVENGTIVSGQGTANVQFSANEPGQVQLSAVFTSDGCTSTPYRSPSIFVHGTPVATVTVEPSVIQAGETAIVRTTGYYGYTGSLTSSLGDELAWIGNDALGTLYEYRSTHGAGVATITYALTNVCGVTTTVTTTLTIENTAPAAATATVRAAGGGCNLSAEARFTGTAPFSGTWSTGETFTTSDSVYYLHVPADGTYTLTSFSDANGAGTITGSATVDYKELPKPELAFDQAPSCLNDIVTVSVTTPIPADGRVTWLLNGGQIVEDVSASTVRIRATSDFSVAAIVDSWEEGCSPESDRISFDIAESLQAPIFDVYGVYAGQSTQIWVRIDPNATSWGFENSLGDAMEVVGTPEPNVYAILYTSSHGTGTSNVRVWAANACGETVETTRTMQILAPRPTATISSVPGETCGATITVTFSGTAPFSGTWENGEQFTTNDSTITRFVSTSGWYYIYDFSDAVSTGDPVSTWVDATYFSQYVNMAIPYETCGTTPATVQAYDVPAGYQVIWSIDPYDNSAGAQIVSGQGTSQVVIEAANGGSYTLMSRYRTPEGCDGPGWGARVRVNTSLAAPVLNVPVTSINAGESFEFTVTFAEASYTDLFWETSNGDPIDFVSWDNGTYTLRYTSVNGAGTSTIRAYGRTQCGYAAESTATITIH